MSIFSFPIFMRHYGLFFVWAGILCLSFSQGLSDSSEVLTGSIRQTAYMSSDQANQTFQGVVYDQTTGQPIAQARVQIPALGLTVFTQGDGSFSFSPNATSAQPSSRRFILNVEKPGFLPGNAILDWERPALSPLQITLQKTRPVVIIDPDLHHLGDNSYSHYSSGAGQFQQHAEGVLLVRHFSLAGALPSPQTQLLIGAVLGLDTLRAHEAGQSTIPYASSPVVVRLNGKTIAHITLNGLRQHIPVPQGLLSPMGYNTLEIQTGYHRPDGVRIDYDDLELMNVILML